MRFRCPYFGELSFLTEHKLEFLGKEARHFPSRNFDYCHNCDENPPKSSNKNRLLCGRYYIYCIIACGRKCALSILDFLYVKRYD